MDSPHQPVVVALSSAPPPKRPRRRRLFIVIILVILVAVALWYWLSAPAAGSVNNSATMTEATNTATGPVEFSGQYIRFSYPATLTLKRHDTNTKLNTEEIFLHRDADDPATNYSIAVTITPASTDINEIAAVRLRRNDPTLYTESINADHVGILFTKESNGYEKTIVWQEAGHDCSVSLTVPVKSVAADDLFTQVMKSSHVNQ